MNLEKTKELKYFYNFYQPEFVTSPIGKLPKIKLNLPKMDILENFEIKLIVEE